MKGKAMSDNDYRVVQFFLSPSQSPGPGIFEVSMSKDGFSYKCTCPGYQGRKTCKHLKFVKARVENNDGTYPMEISTRATKEDAKKATESSDSFREFILKFGKIEVC